MGISFSSSFKIAPLFFSKWMCVLVLSLGSVAAQAAACRITAGNVQSTIALSGTFSVPANAADGSVLATIVSSGESVQPNVNCTDTGGTMYWNITSQPHGMAGSKIYSTNLPGVGVQVVRNRNGTVLPYASTYNPMGNTYIVRPVYNYVFVKMGPIASGVVGAIDVPTANVTVSNPPNGVLSYTTVTGSIKFVVAGCHISIPNVYMGSHKVSEFSSRPFSSNPADVNVQLTNCPQTVPIRYQMDQMTGYANQSQSIVNVTGGAVGVGVQLLDSSGAVPSPMGSQQLIGSGQLNYSLSFKARYYKTGSVVGAGKANAVMGFTLFYQ